MTTTACADSQTLVMQAVKKVNFIATLPEVTSRIVRAVEDPNSSASQLHKIIAHDPALVTRILKIVNSAFYGLPGQIGSVERAIVLLGLNAVKNIAVAASLGQLFRGVKIIEGYTARDLWLHCIGVGVAARELAKQMRLPIAEEAFLAGMIHDVGILLLLQIMPDKLSEVYRKTREGCDFGQAEQQILGFDHQQLGMAQTELWKFPRPCQLVAGYHHRPLALADEHRRLVGLVHVADMLCCQCKLGFDLIYANHRLDSSILDQLGLDQSAVDRTLANLPQLALVAADVLGTGAAAA